MIELNDLLIAKLQELGCETILIVGDINFENTNWKQMRSTDYSEAFVVQKLFKNSFQQVITTKSKLLDVNLTSNTDPVLTFLLIIEFRPFLNLITCHIGRSFQDKAGTEQNSNGRKSKKRFHCLFLYTS